MQGTHHRRKQNDEGYARSRKLDPDVEYVRRRLLRLMIISLIVTILLIGAVLAAVIYKITRPTTGQEADRTTMQQEIRAAVQEEVKAAMIKPESPKEKTDFKSIEIDLPAGTRILSQSISEGVISLETLPPKGGTELIIYDYREGRIMARLRIATAADAPASESTAEEDKAE